MRTTLGQAAEVRLGRQRAPQYEAGDNMVPYLRSANVKEGELDLADVKTMDFSLLEQSLFSLRPGDVLVTEGSGSRDTVGASAVWSGEIDGTVCFQNTLLRLRPRDGLTDGRFLAWWMRHARGSGQVAAVSSGANILHVGSDGLKRLPLTLPTQEEQRRIADFLDERVARIDQIIAARRAQVGAVERLTDSKASLLINDANVGGAPLSSWARIIDTEHKTAPSVEGGGYWIVGTGAIRGGKIIIDELRETDQQHYEEWTARGRPAAGDLVLTREAPVGQVGLVENDMPALAIGQRVVLIRPEFGRLDSRFLRLVLMHGALRRVIHSASAGSLHPHLNMADISRLRVPNLSLPKQIDLGRRHSGLLEETGTRKAHLERSASLLQEYKQSLITAAVTGELDVTTASTRIPGE